MRIDELKINNNYHIKAGGNILEPECVIIIKEKPINGALVHGIRLSDQKDVYIRIDRFLKEISKETHPEYYL